jgi:hypothetical protein
VPVYCDVSAYARPGGEVRAKGAWMSTEPAVVCVTLESCVVGSLGDLGMADMSVAWTPLLRLEGGHRTRAFPASRLVTSPWHAQIWVRCEYMSCACIEAMLNPMDAALLDLDDIQSFPLAPTRTIQSPTRVGEFGTQRSAHEAHSEREAGDVGNTVLFSHVSCIASEIF